MQKGEGMFLNPPAGPYTRKGVAAVNTDALDDEVLGPTYFMKSP